MCAYDLRMARPSIYTPALAAEICERLAAGESLRAICADPDSVFPDRSTINDWIATDREGFADQYARARDVGLDVMADELLQISDEQAVVYTKTGAAFDPDVQRDRLRVDTRKWYLSKLAPKRYGDKLQVEHSGNVSIEDRLRAGRARVAGSE